MYNELIETQHKLKGKIMKASVYKIEETEYTYTGLDGEVIHRFITVWPAKAYRIPRVGEQVHYGSMDPSRHFHGEVTRVTLIKGRELRWK